MTTSINLKIHNFLIVNLVQNGQQHDSQHNDLEGVLQYMFEKHSSHSEYVQLSFC